MAQHGLSLVGFLNEQDGINLLRNTCVVADDSDAALLAEWQKARAQLGAAMPQAGQPQFQPIPAEGQAYLAKLTNEPWVKAQLQNQMAGATFQMVELEPLLAFQFNVDLTRCDHHNGGAGKAPDMQQIFEMCLPLSPSMEDVKVYPSPNASSLLVTTLGLNFRVLAQGFAPHPEGGHWAGILVGPSSPLLHVVRYNGRCYLHNGFHRAVGLTRLGVKYAPCVLRDLPDPGSVGINPGQTFDVNLLESNNPPTVGHFAQNRAYEVMLKHFRRTLHVAWSEYITTDD